MNEWSGSIPSRWSDVYNHPRYPPLCPHCCSVLLNLRGAHGRSGLRSASPQVGVSPGMGGVTRKGRVFSVWVGRPGARRSPRMRPNGPAMAVPVEQLRRRKTRDWSPGRGSLPRPERDPAGSPAHLRAGTFWLTRIVLLRALAFVYCESAGSGPPLVLPLGARPRTPPVTLLRPAPRQPLPQVDCGTACHTLPLRASPPTPGPGSE